ncbi:MAG TPA: FtsX-like permease family protein, partial [Xanthomonadales bacterium]|nr:FtsX-like permease family protein [Xanthomonadales bacterium]
EARDLKHNFVSPQTSTYLGLMFATALCVLLVACANVANLLLSQMASRHREIAVRAALGAGRRRLLVHVLAECFLIALAATGIGLVLAKFGGDLVMDTLAAAGDGAAWFLDVGIDARLVVYSLVIACVTTLLAGLAPALRAAGEAMQEGLREGGKGGGTNGGFARFSRGLVVAEVAISCVLLIGAGASVRSLRTMMDSDIGTDTPAAQLLTGRIGLFPQAYPTGAEQVAVFERIVERLAAEPGVRAATAASILPGSMAAGSQVAAYGEDYANNEFPDVYYGSVGDGFARTYGIELVAGRFFDARDTAASEKVTVVDVRFAERLFPGRDPLGQRIKLNPQAAESEWRTIVGVVANLSIQHLEGDPAPTVLTPLRQDPVRFVTVAVHLDGDVTAFGPRLAEIVREVDADTPVYWVRTHARALEMSRVGPMVLANIFGIFGIVGLVLAGAGLYGVLSFGVAQRTREIGLRRAIGAESSDIVRAITTRSAWQVGLGLAIGLALGVPWSMLLAREELGVAAIDPLIFGSVIATIALAALLSSLVPARRALGVEPIQALRWE